MDELTHLVKYDLEHITSPSHGWTNKGTQGISQTEDIRQECPPADCEDKQCLKSTVIWYDENIAHLTLNDIKEMVFESWEEARTFYLQYSKHVGFGIRKCDSQKNKAEDFRRMKWVCRKEGVRDKGRVDASDTSKRHPRAEIRVNYDAHITVKMNKKTGVWVVQDIVTKHNHELAAIPSHRMIDKGDKAQVPSLQDVRVKTRQITELISKQKGGYHHMGFTHKDMNNILCRERVRQVAIGDVNKAMGYFEAKKASNPGFYYAHTLTEAGEMENMFWAYSISRMQYVHFGDVLAFNACYKRIVYEHTLIILVGVNNYDQSIIFGVALLKHEQMRSYVWLLNTFLDFTGGKKPLSVITDGCQSMRGALRQVMHEVTHRLCIWHIKRNASREVKDPQFLKKFELCIDVDDANDFEVLWETLVQEHNLLSSKWCQLLSNDKELWAECFLKGKFFAALCLTSRCEGMHSYLRAWVTTPLHVSKFVLRFDDALAKIRCKECALDYESQDSLPVCTNALRVFEKHAA